MRTMILVALALVAAPALAQPAFDDSELGQAARDCFAHLMPIRPMPGRQREYQPGWEACHDITARWSEQVAAREAARRSAEERAALDRINVLADKLKAAEPSPAAPPQQ